MIDDAQNATPGLGTRFTVNQEDVILKEKHPGTAIGDGTPVQPCAEALRNPRDTHMQEPTGTYRVTKQAGIMMKTGEYATEKVKRLLYGCHVAKLEEGERSENWRVRCVVTGVEGWVPSSFLLRSPANTHKSRPPPAHPLRLSATFVPQPNLARRLSATSREGSLNVIPLTTPPPIGLRFDTTMAAYTQHRASRSSVESTMAFRPTLATTNPMRIANPASTTVRIPRQQQGAPVGILKKPGYGFSSTSLGKPSVRFTIADEEADDVLSVMEEMELNLATQADDTEELPSPVPMSQDMSPSKGTQPQHTVTRWRRWVQSWTKPA